MSNSNNSNANTKNTKKKGARSAAAIERRKAKWATQKAAKKTAALAAQQAKKNEETRKQQAVLTMFPNAMSIAAAQGFMPNIYKIKTLSKTMKNKINSVPMFGDTERSTIYPSGKTLLGKYLSERNWVKSMNTLQKGVSKEVLQEPFYTDASRTFTSPLHYAYLEGQISIFKKLLDKGADPNMLLSNMARKNDPIISYIILDKKRTTEAKLPYIEELLKHKANLNLYDSLNMSPLDVAFSVRDIDITKLLLEYGADPNKPNPKGFTPFLTAITSGNTAIVKYLLDNKKVDLNKVTGEKLFTPLKMATIGGLATILQDIVNAGVDNIDEKDHLGNTALHYAVMANNLKKVAILMKAGANPRISNKKNTTPFDIAQIYRDKGDNRVYNLLKGE